MQRQELEAHATGLSGEPGTHHRSHVDRQVVGHDYQPSTRPPSTDGLQQLHELACAAPRTYAEHDLAVAHVPASQDRQHSMTLVVNVDPLWPTNRHASARVQPLQDLDLCLLVHADNPTAPRRMQVKTDHTADLASEIRVRAVQPALHPMGLERRMLEPSSYRALADRLLDKTPPACRLGQRPQSPVRPRRRQFARGVTRQSQDLMPLFGGKTSVDDPNACRPAGPRAAASRSGATSAAPICDRGAGLVRSPRCSHLPTPSALPELESQPITPSGRDVVASGARHVPLRSAADAAWKTSSFSCTGGYLMTSPSWGGTFGTRH